MSKPVERGVVLPGMAEGQTGAKYVPASERLGTDAIAYELGIAQDPGFEGENAPKRRGAPDPVEEWKGKDPILAQLDEQERYRQAGRRRGSHLDPNWVPEYRPYDGNESRSVTDGPLLSPRERIAELRQHLGQTVRVTGDTEFRRDLQDWLVDGSAVGVLPRPDRPESVIERGIEVPPKGAEQVRNVLGPLNHLTPFPGAIMYWSALLPEDPNEEPVRRYPSWLKTWERGEASMGYVQSGGRSTKGGAIGEDDDL